MSERSRHRLASVSRIQGCEAGGVLTCDWGCLPGLSQCFALFASLLVASSCSLLNQPRKDRRAGMQWLGLPWRSDLCRLSESGLHAHLHAGNGRMLGWGGLHPA